MIRKIIDFIISLFKINKDVLIPPKNSEIKVEIIQEENKMGREIRATGNKDQDNLAISQANIGDIFIRVNGTRVVLTQDDLNWAKNQLPQLPPENPGNSFAAPENVPQINERPHPIIIENLLTLGKQNRPGEKIIDLRAIALHWLAAPNQRPINTRAWFESAQVFGSTQYIIGPDGETMRVIPEDEIGYHIGSSQNDPVSGRIYTDFARKLLGPEPFAGRTSPRGFWITPNYYAIGIEMSHLDNNPGTFSKETLDACALLCSDILIRNNKTVEILTTHYEIVGWKDCPKLWYNQPQLFVDFKKKVNALMPAQLRLDDNSIIINYQPKK